jgi:hypothetical protein
MRTSEDLWNDRPHDHHDVHYFREKGVADELLNDRVV